MLVEMDFEAKTWVEFGTFKDGTQTSSEGNLVSVTQSEIVLHEQSYANLKPPERETISRLSGAYSSVEYDDRHGTPLTFITSGTCNKTRKPLPSSKF